MVSGQQEQLVCMWQPSVFPQLFFNDEKRHQISGFVCVCEREWERDGRGEVKRKTKTLIINYLFYVENVLLSVLSTKHLVRLMIERRSPCNLEPNVQSCTAWVMKAHVTPHLIFCRLTFSRKHLMLLSGKIS